ncbi:MAG TPA: hypothetical protein PKO45_08225 [Rubrivivax sp.]|nr:hypothetical protein [Burkholderiales bacterium]HNT39093.1 hypothetical protein [Rubrivivax sp.]
MKRSPVVQRLSALFVAGWLAFDFPLAQLWVQRPIAVFALWAAVIAALAWIMERHDD